MWPLPRYVRVTLVSRGTHEPVGHAAASAIRACAFRVHVKDAEMGRESCQGDPTCLVDVRFGDHEAGSPLEVDYDVNDASRSFLAATELACELPVSAGRAMAVFVSAWATLVALLGAALGVASLVIAAVIERRRARW